MFDAGRAREAKQALGQLNVFHQGKICEAADGIKSRARDKHGLIPGGNSRPAGPQVHHALHNPQHKVAAIDTHIETTPAVIRTCQGRVHQGAGIVRQLRVRMQKKQNLTAGTPGTGIHLLGPTARSTQHRKSGQFCNMGRTVLATAIDDENIAAPPLQRHQAFEQAG